MERGTRQGRRVIEVDPWSGVDDLDPSLQCICRILWKMEGRTK